MDASKWPDLSEELERMEIPDGLPDPRDAFYAVFLLGPVWVFRAGQRVVGGWRLKSLELLAYLAVHPLGAAKDQILEALWPNGNPRQTQHNLWHAVSLLRSRLGGSSASGRIVHKADDLYRLDFENVWVDVASFEGAVKLAGRGADPRTPLRFACDLYKGGFCDGRYYDWATLSREKLARLFIQGAQILGGALSDNGEESEALHFLERAMESDPYDEELCRRAMVIDVRLGRMDRATRRLRRLRRLLITDLGVEPSKETVTGLQQLMDDANYKKVVVGPGNHNAEDGHGDDA